MDTQTKLLLAALILSVIAYFAQTALAKSVYMKTGNYVKTGKLLPGLAGFGILGCLAGMKDAPDVMMFGVAIAAVCVVVMAVLNLKAAGVGMAIALAVLQALAGVIIIVRVILAIALRFVGVQLGFGTSSNTVPTAWEQARQAQEAQRKAKTEELQKEAQEEQELKDYNSYYKPFEDQ